MRAFSKNQPRRRLAARPRVRLLLLSDGQWWNETPSVRHKPEKFMHEVTECTIDDFHEWTSPSVGWTKESRLSNIKAMSSHTLAQQLELLRLFTKMVIDYSIIPESDTGFILIENINHVLLLISIWLLCRYTKQLRQSQPGLKRRTRRTVRTRTAQITRPEESSYFVRLISSAENTESPYWRLVFTFHHWS